MSDALELDQFDDIFGVVEDRSIVQSKNFKPWHKPRKQWVRSCQWTNAILTLVKTAEYRDIDTLRYFGFPGADCLDVQVIGSALGPENKKLSFYGLETSDDQGRLLQDVVQSILKDCDYICSTSTIRPNTRFEVLAENNSALASDIKSLSPFHVVNLDFINSVMNSDDQSKTMKSIHRFLSYQFDRQYNKWVLFITTRADIQTTCLDNLNRYIKPLMDNIRDNDSFCRLFNDKILGKDDDLKRSAQDISNNTDNFEKITILVMLKWMLVNCIDRNINMKITSVVDYKVRDSNQSNDMYSIVLEFKKIDNYRDVAILSNDNLIQNDELGSALKLIKYVSKSTNIDSLLNDQQDLNDTMVSQVKELLKPLGYNMDEYINNI